MNFVRKFRDAAIVATLLAIPFFFLKANLTDPSHTTWLDELILKASSPIQYVITEAARGVSDIIEEYVYLVEVEEDNEALRAENARLEQQVVGRVGDVVGAGVPQRVGDRTVEDRQQLRHRSAEGLALVEHAVAAVGDAVDPANPRRRRAVESDVHRPFEPGRERHGAAAVEAAPLETE